MNSLDPSLGRAGQTINSNQQSGWRQYWRANGSDNTARVAHSPPVSGGRELTAMFSISEPSIHARLIVLSLAPGQWFLTWCLRYANLMPVSRPLKAALAGLLAATALLGTLILQTAVYRAITGVTVPAHDNYFFAIIIGEDIVALCIIFLIAFDLRRKSSR